LIPRRYAYFDVVVGLAWSYDPESYAGGSVAAGRVSHAGQVEGDDSDKKGYPGPPVGGWAWGWWPHPIKTLTVEKLSTIAGTIVKEAKVHHGLQRPKKQMVTLDGCLVF
jgi:hypothetical protein